MKFAAFNVENLFDRAKAFNMESSSEASKIIKSVAELNGLFEKRNYSNADKQRMIQIAGDLQLNRFEEGPFARIRRIRGSIFRRPNTGGIDVVADGRDSWIGWAELKTAPVNEVAILNTGRVIRDVDADVLAVVEAENRVALKYFSEFVFNMVKDEVQIQTNPYHQIMLIDGNDERGIDVGLMTKEGFDIGAMHSHIHDTKANASAAEIGRDLIPENFPNTPIFSRDCPVYAVTTPGGETIWFLPNHFKSKHGGNDQRSRDKRRAQAVFTRVIYERLRHQGENLVVILGDLNDTPDSAELAPLLGRSDLRDVFEHPNFDPGQFAGTGTYGLGNDTDKIDYLLLSPALFGRVTAAGLFRKGAWPGVRPKRWDVYEQLKEKVHVASDHHVIWVEIA